jgi:hypothetical protein
LAGKPGLPSQSRTARKPQPEYDSFERTDMVGQTVQDKTSVSEKRYNLLYMWCINEMDILKI